MKLSRTDRTDQRISPPPRRGAGPFTVTLGATILVATALLLPPLSAKPTPKTISKPAVQKAGSADKGRPLGVIRAYESEVKAVLHRFAGRQGDKAQAEKRQVLQQKVRKFFDFNELGRLSLEQHWPKLSKKDRDAFLATFSGLVEKTYLSRTNELVADYNMKFGNETVEGKRAKVTSTIIKDEDLDIEVIYQLRKKGKSWVIYNIVLDNLNLLNNYRSQFNRIISKKSFAELMRMMQARLKSTEEII